MKHVLDDVTPGPVAPVVYVLDDDPAVVQALVFSLTANGCRAFGHTMAEPLLAALVQERGPCALLADIRMPGPGGLAIARQARTLVPDLTVFLMSGSSEAGTALRSHGEGPVFQKPFDIAELLQRLGR